jgi:cubilin
VAYDGTTSGCGGDLTASRGTILSPNYPLPYSHNAECYWTISVARGSRIQLTFQEFAIESHESCSYDYIKVREEDSRGEIQGHFCGTVMPPTIVSKGSKLWLEFRTDYSNNAAGFVANYEAICNVTITGHLGVIESPNFPESYPSNTRCNWTIETTPGNRINISFSHLSLEGSDMQL